MLKVDADALECDLMEYYHIDNFRRLPLTRVAVFAYGLPDNSRIKRRLSGQKLPLDTLLLASIFDQLNAVMYSMTKDAKSGRHRPQSLVQLLTGEQPVNDEPAYETSKDFEKAREELLERIRKEEADGNNNR